MCYSAEASFTAAVIVGVIGCATIKQARTPKQLPLAVIPLLFALHQAAEGVQWVFLQADIPPNMLSTAAMWFYVFLGFILWPTWFSLSALALEEVPWRKKALYGCLVVGMAVSVFNIWHFATHGTYVHLINDSIHYANSDHRQWAFYLGVLSMPYLLSSVPLLWALGAFAPISFTIAGYLYWANFASTWCFWAAFLSCWIFLVIYKSSNQSTRS